MRNTTTKTITVTRHEFNAFLDSLEAWFVDLKATRKYQICINDGDSYASGKFETLWTLMTGIRKGNKKKGIQDTFLFDGLNTEHTEFQHAKFYADFYQNRDKQDEFVVPLEDLHALAELMGCGEGYYYKWQSEYKKNASSPPPTDLNASSLPRHLTLLPDVGDFVGRQEELTQIDALLKEGKPVLVVNGLGGIGKTTLALAYAHQHGAQYGHIAWIRQQQTLMEAIAFDVPLHQSLGVSFEAEIPTFERAKGILYALQEQRGTVNLLVVDNFSRKAEDEAKNFLACFPFGTWRVLFTSRETIPQFAKIDLDVLPEKDAIKLFRQYIGNKKADETELKALLQSVGYHTLTVELLAKTYHKSQRLKSVGEMATLLQAQQIDASILQKEVQTPHTGEQVRVYEYLLRIFAISGLDEKELFVLRQFAALPALPLDCELFLLLVQDKEGVYEDSLLSLRDKGWLSYNEENAYFSMHSLVQMLMRKQLKPTLQDCENMVNTFIALMGSDDVEASPLEHRWLLSVGEALIEHVDFQENLEKKGLLWNKLYWVYDSLGEYENALRCTKESLEAAEKTAGKQSKNYLSSLNNLGMLYKSMGAYEQALPLLQEFTNLSKEILGEQHPNYLISLNNLAGLYYAMGKYERALPLYMECLQLRKEVLGERHPDYLTSLNNLAGLYRAMGAYEKALPLYMECLQFSKEVLGERHPDYLTPLNNLGQLYKEMGEYEKALPLYMECLQLRKEVLGERHPDNLSSLNNLAGLYHAIGAYEQASPLLQEFTNLSKEILGGRHPHYFSSLNNLGVLYDAMGAYEQSLPLYRECLQLRKEVLGERHPDYFSSLHNLGTWYFAQNRHQEALPYFDNAYRGFAEVLGEAHPSTKNTKKHLYHTQARLINARLQEILPEDWQSNPEAIRENEEIRTLFFALKKVREELKAMQPNKNII